MHGTGDAVRVVLFDYRKDFDLIDHHILASKRFQLTIPCTFNSLSHELNLGKCKELLIYFGKTANSFPGVRIFCVQLEVVEHAKMLGLTISSNLKWNEHVSKIIKKANKRPYFIVQLKRAKGYYQCLFHLHQTSS